jgi:diacylglycerol kinase family enzyme
VKVRIIVNRGGGSATPDVEDRLKAAFDGLGVDPQVRLVEPGELDRHCADAAREAGVDALVAAGGDGTIGTAAAAVADTGMALGILPMGTLNHFARDAGIPLDLRAAAEAIAGGHTRQVDLAEVNGRIFINNSAVGLYPRMVRRREAQQEHLGRGKRLAMLVASFRTLRHFSSDRLTIRVEGRQEPIETPLLFVGNNRYSMSLMGLGTRETIDRGELCLYAPLAKSRLRFFSVAARAILGRTDRQSDFISLDGIAAAEIHSRRPRLMVATDGEVQTMETPLRYRIRAGALKLIVPKEA